jgi:hypothetical protein
MMYDSRTNLDQPQPGKDIVEELIEADQRIKEQFGIQTNTNSLMLRAAKEIIRLRGF